VEQLGKQSDKRPALLDLLSGLAPKKGERTRSLVRDINETTEE